jgi:Uma2 family endonuclease
VPANHVPPGEPAFVEVPDDDSEPNYEIVDGEKLEKPASLLSQVIESIVTRLIGNHLHETATGGVLTAEPWVLCFDWKPGDRRRPDVAYWRAEKYPDGLPPRGEAREGPALVVEVLSPNDLALDVDRRLADFFRAGTELAWVVNPDTRTVRAERPDGTAFVSRGDAAVMVDPVLPGLKLNASRLFPKVAAEA